MQPCKLVKINHPSGYAYTYFGGKIIQAHRVAFYRYNGYWPVVCLHSCDVKNCIEPTHLVNGTQANNLNDAITKGRLRGTVITDDIISSIIRYRKQGKRQSWIAQTLKIAQGTVSNVLRRAACL